MRAARSGVSFPCPWIVLRIVCLRSASWRALRIASAMRRTSTSSRPPVWSRRYRVMKGTVFPSSSSCTAAATPAGTSPRRWAICPRSMTAMGAIRLASLGPMAPWQRRTPPFCRRPTLQQVRTAGLLEGRNLWSETGRCQTLPSACPRCPASPRPPRPPQTTRIGLVTASATLGIDGPSKPHLFPAFCASGGKKRPPDHESEDTDK